MATVAHHIVSHYTTPADEGDDIQEEDIDFLWQKESAQIKPLARRPYRIPTFVRATAASDSLDGGREEQEAEVEDDSAKAKNIGVWYRQLYTSRQNAPLHHQAGTVAGPSRRPSLQLLRQAPSRSAPSKHAHKHKPRQSDSDWFIHRALRSEPEGLREVAPSASTTLADLLVQQPPPLPHDQPFRPPIWYGIDPNNKGFELLRKNGWREGHGLGVSHPRRVDMEEEMVQDGEGGRPGVNRSASSEVEGGCRTGSHLQDASLKEEPLKDIIDLTESPPPEDFSFKSDAQSVREALKREGRDDVIDLTLSPSPSPTPDDSIFHPPPLAPPQAPVSASTALLTPLRPVLKNDRLGLGLKAKKRSSLSQKQLAAHIREGAEAKRKADMLKRGRGAKGFARQKKKEEDARRQLLSYMNS